MGDEVKLIHRRELEKMPTTIADDLIAKAVNDCIVRINEILTSAQSKAKTYVDTYLDCGDYPDTVFFEVKKLLKENAYKVSMEKRVTDDDNYDYSLRISWGRNCD
jgi:hypothetical protein